ncbi:MAG: hypothetical protein V1704_04365 [Candidatus Vogelbacteria bacterium]
MKKGKIISPTKQKVLLLLATGLTLGLSRSFHNQRRILKILPKAWKEIDRRYLYRIINEFHHDRLADYREREDGTIDIVLTEAGKQKALSFKIDTMIIPKPSRWDKKWRLVVFDIPETKRPARDALRLKLRELGFKEFQKSVFVHPYPCTDEINFIVEFFEVRSHVHLAEVSKLSNDSKLRLHFDLPA